MRSKKVMGSKITNNKNSKNITTDNMDKKIISQKSDDYLSSMEDHKESCHKEMTSEEERKFIGIQIKQARKEKKITQLELSKSINLSRSYLSDIENGRYMPSVRTITALAQKLELDLNFLGSMT